MGREDPPEDARRIDDGYEIVGDVGRGASFLRLDDDEVEGQECADVDEERTDGEEQEWCLEKRHEIFFQGERLWGGREAGLDGYVGEDQKPEDKESRDAYGPPKAELHDQTLDHNGKYDTAQTGSRYHDAERKRSVSLEPSACRGNS